MKNILITGGAGFLGHHLVKKLLDTNVNKVIILDNKSNANEAFINHIDNPKGSFDERIVFYKKDIRHPLFDIFQKEEDIDTCIHLAAKISAVEATEETIDVNVKGTFNVLEAASENNVNNFVFLSSSAVYGVANKFPITEEEKLKPTNVYGATKVAGESLLTAYKNLGKIPHAVILRSFNMYGKGQSKNYAGAISIFAERLSKGLPPVISGDGKQIREFISVNDVVNAIILAAEAKLDTIEAFNIAVGQPISINDLAKIMMKIFNKDIDIEPIYEKPRPGDPPIAHADVSKAKEILKFKATKDLKLELKNMFP